MAVGGRPHDWEIPTTRYLNEAQDYPKPKFPREGRGCRIEVSWPPFLSRFCFFLFFWECLNQFAYFCCCALGFFGFFGLGSSWSFPVRHQHLKNQKTKESKSTAAKVGKLTEAFPKNPKTNKIWKEMAASKVGSCSCAPRAFFFGFEDLKQ